MATPATASPVAAPGAWAPLAQPTFRALWLAMLTGNIGSSVHDVAAAWVMAERTNSPVMVAAVQAAMTLPMVLFALLAGTLADIVDRRRYLIAVQCWMLLVASSLALLSSRGLLTPTALILLTIGLGIGGAMSLPAQQALTPELVPRELLPPAVALGSLSMNIARSIGPALGGLVVAHWSPAAAFALNAVSFLTLATVLLRWKRQAPVRALPPETFGSALRAGVRFALHAPALQSVLAKAATFFVFASAYTALLPIVVKQELKAGAGTYGVLLGCVGIGAIAGALVLPRLRARISPDRIVFAASVTYAVAILALGVVRVVPALYLVSLVGGFAWISVLSSFNIAAQTALPAWVRARALSLYIVVFSGGLACGSLVWGTVAQHTSPRASLVAAGVGTLLAAFVGLRFHLGKPGGFNTAPSGHWPQPMVDVGVDADAGPVLITIEYRVRLDARAEFQSIARALGQTRRRDGALAWDVFEDTAHPGLMLEYFTVGSWLEHLRQHQRVTEDDRALQARILPLLEQGTTPQVRHFVRGAVPPGHVHPVEDAP